MKDKDLTEVLEAISFVTNRMAINMKKIMERKEKVENVRRYIKVKDGV